jgi:hypothetical protein
MHDATEEGLLMNGACHLLYPFTSAIAPNLQPADLLCARAPDAVIGVGLFVALCLVISVAFIVGIVRDVVEAEKILRR